MKQPHHIKMIKKVPVADRSKEEKQMIQDFNDGKGDYGPTGAWDTTANGNVLGFEKSAAKWNDKKYKRCYEDHPALPIVLTEYQTVYVYGGSCGTPIHSDADVYVGLDWKMADHKQRLPWVEGHAIHYEITDGTAPKNAEEFKELISWLAEKITAGKKIHVGCIGGHGRTGTVLAALVGHMMPDEKAPIAYVRKHYCKKAVESKTQVAFLKKHFGCEDIIGSKDHSGSFGGSTKSKFGGKPAKKSVPPIQSLANVFGKYIVKSEID